jgi:hypothetical protein
LLLLTKNIKKIKNDKGPSPVISVIFLVLLSFLLLLTGCLFSPLSKGSVEGYIHEETVIDTRPLEGALISITGSSNTALTDADGYFRIDEVSIGARTLTITKEAYITYKILSIVIKEDEITVIDNGKIPSLFGRLMINISLMEELSITIQANIQMLLLLFNNWLPNFRTAPTLMTPNITWAILTKTNLATTSRPSLNIKNL